MSEIVLHFHFLRPWWLAGLLPTLALILWNLRLRKLSGGVDSLFAPHLLPHLLVKTGRKNHITPLQMLITFWLICILALAGPTWQQEPSPFAEDQAALVIILKVTPSMLAKDIQPSRLERSVHKIKDILSLRAGAKTALIAYSGSAHLVMPLTQDESIISTFASELTPEIMPQEGDSVTEALHLGASILEQAKAKGSLLLVTDNIGDIHQSGLQDYAKNHSIPINILAIAAPPGGSIPTDSPPAPALDMVSLKKTANIINARLTFVSPDSSDVESINTNILRNHKQMMSSGENLRWRDSGYLAVPLLLLISLFWSRRNWFVRWEG